MQTCAVLTQSSHRNCDTEACKMGYALSVETIKKYQNAPVEGLFGLKAISRQQTDYHGTRAYLAKAGRALVKLRK
jgi:hypothetical protein